MTQLGARAAIVQQDAQPFFRFILPYLNRPVDNVRVAHFEHVRWSLTRQIIQIHRVLQINARIKINRIPNRSIGIKIARRFFVFSY
ncbi:hypothetical protein JZU54_06230, partial [bacterium]|nr:hypothetical protein [bacterium]